MHSVCPPGYHYNAFMGTPELGHIVQYVCVFCIYSIVFNLFRKKLSLFSVLNLLLFSILQHSQWSAVIGIFIYGAV